MQKLLFSGNDNFKRMDIRFQRPEMKFSLMVKGIVFKTNLMTVTTNHLLSNVMPSKPSRPISSITACVTKFNDDIVYYLYFLQFL